MESIVLKNIYGKEVKLTITNEQKDANFITHSGTFHADEVMATCILVNMYSDIKLFRTNEITNNDAFIYDIGFGKYDHHGIDFNKNRENGIKYASCGLIWNEFGMKILNNLDINYKKELFDSIDKNIITDIDRDDNGQSVYNSSNIKIQSIPSLIASFNPSWDEDANENICFLQAVKFANIVFNNLVLKNISKLKAKDIVEEKINQSKDNILLLDRYMPWKDIVLSSKNKKAKDILYAIFPSKRGGYNIVGVPTNSNSFDVKKPFPKKWGGKSSLELKNITNVSTFRFCHVNLFLCASLTLEDAIKIAKLSINNTE